MSLETILAELKAERGRLDQAITGLQGVTGQPGSTESAAPARRRKRGRRKWTPEMRQRLSEAKKAWWAKRKGKRLAKRRG